MWTPTAQHPDHDVALGEQLFKDIYEALRAGPRWNETLFIITMDEHGACMSVLGHTTSCLAARVLPS